MSAIRELTTSELDIVSGGCGHQSRPQCGGGWSGSQCSSSLAGQIGAYAGYLAGMYNVGADYFNHASCSTIASAWKNVASDVSLGYSTTKNMSVSAAMQFLQQTISSIQSAVTVNSCGFITGETLIAFPAGQQSGFG